MRWTSFSLALLVLVPDISAFQCSSNETLLTGNQFPPAGVSNAYNGSMLCYWIIPRINGSYTEVTINQGPNRVDKLKFDDYRGTFIDYDSNTWLGFVSPSEIHIQFQSGYPPAPGNLSFSWIYKTIPVSSNPTRVNLKTGTPGTLIPVSGQNTTTIFTYDWNIAFQAAFNPDVPRFYMMYSWYFIGEGVDGWYLGSMYHIAGQSLVDVADGWTDNRTTVFTLVTMVPDPTIDYGVVLVKPYIDMVNVDTHKLQYAPKSPTNYKNIGAKKPQVLTFYSGIHSNVMYMTEPYVNQGATLSWYSGDYYQNAMPKAVYGSDNVAGFAPQQVSGQLNTFVGMNGNSGFTISPNTFSNPFDRVILILISLYIVCQ